MKINILRVYKNASVRGLDEWESGEEEEEKEKEEGSVVLGLSIQ